MRLGVREGEEAEEEGKVGLCLMQRCVYLRREVRLQVFTECESWMHVLVYK